MPLDPWPPLRPGRHTLLEFTDRLFSILDELDDKLVRDFCDDSGVLNWGSACSGTESPTWSVDALCECLRRRQVACDVVHTFAAELAEDKRGFIRRCSRRSVRQLFADMWELSGESALNVMTNAVEAVQTSNCFSTWVGFSCKTVSTLNADQATADSAVDQAAGSTGQTFLATRRLAFRILNK